MEKTVLFAGKEYPAGSAFASAAINHNRSTVITVPFATEKTEEIIDSPDITTVVWNKSSSVSARSVVLQAENVYQRLDEAVLVFDTAWFASTYNSLTPELCSRGVDAMISGYLYLSMELVARFTKLKHGTLIFMLKGAPGIADSTGSSVFRGDNSGLPAGILPSSAEAMFKALAESTAASCASNEDIRVLLVRGEYDTSDSLFAGWMFEYIDTLPPGKGKHDIRHAVQWLKMGARQSTGFSLFRK
ncbi:MAG: hypothetical protein J6B32_06190 [Spirochaetaceae bacterium]|nr:hypothetical protein [Spirochaetaceae bacterium]